jgi:hypothetical protein
MQRPEVIGCSDFVEQVTWALDLLDARMPGVLAFVCDFIGQIKETPRTGLRDDVHPPVCELSAKTAFTSHTWCAGTIVHEACHARQNADRLARGFSGITACASTLAQSEREAIDYQLRVIEGLGAPLYELNWLRNQDGWHFDLDKDGDFDWDDYVLRDW